jgi:microcystin-dependent protein
MGLGIIGAVVGELRMYAGGGAGSNNVVNLSGDPGVEQQVVTGWLLANGAPVSRVTYANLFAVIGTAYGVGNGSTTFNLPNLQQKFPLGRSTLAPGTVVGERSGSMNHSHTMSHTHSFQHQHDLASHTHGMGHTHDLSNHLHVVAHDHFVSGQTSGPNAGSFGGSVGTNATFGSSLGLATNDHSHSWSARTDGGSRFQSDGPNVNQTGGPSVSTTAGPSTNLSGFVFGSTVTSDASVGSTAGVSAYPPYQVVHFIIKY